MTSSGTMAAKLRHLAAALERQLKEDRLQEGEEWFLVASSWWSRVLSDEDGAETDEEEEDSDDAIPRGNSALSVQNEELLDLQLSSRKRGVAVLKSMLVRG
jgi:hypothetical protein